MISNPPPGTSNTAHVTCAYPQVLRDLRSEGLGAYTYGPEQMDGYTNNSFNIGTYPEESLDDKSNLPTTSSAC